MNYAKSVSLLCIGAFIAFALTYYGVISDPGQGAYYALGLAATVWIVTLENRRRGEAKSFQARE